MTMTWPLMDNNITRADTQALIKFLEDDPILTQNKNVRAFEEEWSQWLGVKHSVFVNSGASANLITMGAYSQVREPGEVIVAPFGWISTIAAVIQNGFTPVFADIDLKTLAISDEQLMAKITPKTKAVFLTHAQGLNGLSDAMLAELEKRGIDLIEDVCESHGATHKGRKAGTFGLMSNFSYYYAHHMSTIEGGMVSTNDDQLYQYLRIYRSHGMVREATDETIKQKYYDAYPALNRDFIFAFPAYNVRNHEIGGVLGREQLKRLDANNAKRIANFDRFLKGLDPKKYYTDFNLEGSCNYAFNLVLREADDALCSRVMEALQREGVEFRRGSAGGGNQLRQPYLQKFVGPDAYKSCPVTDFVHYYGFYIGNYPDLPSEKIQWLCDLLNGL